MLLRIHSIVVLSASLSFIALSGCSHGGGSSFNITTPASTSTNTSSSTTPTPTATPTSAPTATPTPTATPPVTSSSGGTVSIGVGGGHVCAVNGGAVYCWGDNTEGSLGNNSQTSSNAPVQVSGIGPGGGATYVPRLSTYSSCALVSGGVKCWGDNSSGETGNGGTPPSTTFACAGTGNVNYSNGATANTVPVWVAGLGAGANVSDIAMSENGSSCVIVNGAVECWGTNIYGNLGNGTFNCHSTPGAVSGISSGATDIAMGGYFGCSIVNGAVQCWGDNTYGQLGTTTSFCSGSGSNCSTVPVSAAVSGSFVHVAAGYGHTCALRNDGAVFCWGSNSNGQLGNGSTTSTSVPQMVSGLGAGSGVIQITAGSYSTCAVKSDGSGYCWGSGTMGQLGNNSLTSSSVPVAISGLGAGSGTTALSVDFANSCAVVNGHAYCWGTNYYGNLGTGSSANDYVPVAVLGL